MTSFKLTVQEKNWADYYNCLSQWRRTRKLEKYNEKFIHWLEDFAEAEKNNEDFFIRDDEFDTNLYFKLIFSLRILNILIGGREQQERILRENKADRFDKETIRDIVKISEIEIKGKFVIPERVLDYLTWWINIGFDPNSVIENIFDEDIIHHPQVPDWIKVHVLSRFIMRRNSALTGSRNFEKNKHEIVNDSEQAVSYAEKYLRRAKDRSQLKENDFADTKFIETLFMVEKLLLNVRIQKDIDEIIRMATETMGYSLTTTNRIWGGVVGYWCSHVLWRCFVCKGEIATAELFKQNSKSLIKYIEKSFDITMSGSYNYENYDTTYRSNIANMHYEYIKKVIKMKEIPIYTSKIKINKELMRVGKGGDDESELYQIRLDEGKTKSVEKKDFEKYAKKSKNKLFESRVKFYENFIGIEMEKYKFNKGKNTMGAPIKLFGESQRNRGDWDCRINQIPLAMKKTINYLDKSNNIVSIPTIRLVVIDLLLLLSRLLISINPEEKEPNNFYSDSEKRISVW